MSTAEELLCSRKWRITHSAWMLWGWFPFGLTAWIGYLIIGIRARNWKWIVTAIAFFVYGSVWLGVISWIGGATNTQKGEATPEPYATYSTIAILTSFVVWIGNAAVLQWWINRKWLVWRAHHDKSVTTPWYATATAGRAPLTQDAPQQVGSVIDNALAIGPVSNAPVITPPGPPAPPSMPPKPAPPGATGALATININSATVSDIAALPGFDVAVAAHVVAVRSELGSFSDVAELVSRAGVKPHILAGLQGRVAISTEPAVAVVDPPTSRRSVPTRDSGRRLEF